MLPRVSRLNLSPQSFASISRPDSHDSFDVARLHSSLVPQSGASSASGRIAGGRRFDTPRCSVALAAGVSVPRDEKLPPGTRLDLVIVQKSADPGGSAIRTRRHRKCSHSLSFWGPRCQQSPVHRTYLSTAEASARDLRSWFSAETRSLGPAPQVALPRRRPN